MKADLFDFDKTICAGDCGSAFWLYCLLRRPWIVVILPLQAVSGICYLAGVCPRIWKDLSIYTFLRFFDAEKLIEGFWARNERKVFAYFKERESSLPFVVCSASPDFLLEPICKKLGAYKLIATRVDVKTGKITGESCKGREKVVRLKKELPDLEYENVYSDSLKHDIHILRLGKNAFQVVKGNVKKL